MVAGNVSRGYKPLNMLGLCLGIRVDPWKLRVLELLMRCELNFHL